MNRPSGQARVAHHIPGRLRVVIKTARGELPLLVKVAEHVRELQGVDWVRLSPQTGSLVVYYDEHRSGIEEAVKELGVHTGLFDLVCASSAPQSGQDPRSGSRLAHALIGWGRGLDQELSLVTDGALDIRSLVPLCFAVASALTARRARGPTPLWITLAIFAFNSFEALNREIAPAEAEAGDADD